ncbi:hypothetical protein CCH79_00019179 [Gambusia affinis]|uniref:RING-type E3 ubiquitin transferase n=1 Tax=Gambusia affinis TaxID=33528 RepID=A0A315UQ58_GAMAF|nr:hypothetical protein CCH79_00019179 [Gambusia affinis]
MANPDHRLHETVLEKQSIFSQRLLQTYCNTDCYWEKAKELILFYRLCLTPNCHNMVMARYFLHGVCREGSNCLFSHDLNNSKPSTICKYYQRGTCAYGERCRYDHVKHSMRGGGGGASADPVGAGRGVRGEGKKPLVLKDRALCGDRTFGGLSDGPTPAVPEAAAAPQSYVEAIRTGLDGSAPEPEPHAVGGAYQLCPYAAAGHCFYGDSCPYLHGDLCEVCRLQVLHPHDPEQRRAHEKVCLLAFEADMEKAFAAQLSQNKRPDRAVPVQVCSICMEVVVQKAAPSERRSCPECRIISEFVIPSVYWVEDQEEKDQLIELFKSGVSKKACKYFDQGRGSCPFGGNCLYLHAYPDGTRPEPDRPRKQLSSEGNVRVRTHYCPYALALRGLWF